MKRLAGVTAAACAALVLAPAGLRAAGCRYRRRRRSASASSRARPSTSPATTRASRWRCRTGTALGAVRVTLNGADVTSAFGPDPEGNHQLEGVVKGLPLGAERDRR